MSAFFSSLSARPRRHWRERRTTVCQQNGPPSSGGSRVHMRQPHGSGHVMTPCRRLKHVSRPEGEAMSSIKMFHAAGGNRYRVTPACRDSPKNFQIDA